MLSFPADVKAIRQFLPGGAVEYKLSHPEVGELGHIVVIPNHGGQTEIRHEVFKGSDDGQHSRRQELLADIERSVAAAFRRVGVAWK